MLARQEVGSREHILSWLADQPTEQRFEWLSSQCPCGQYGDKFGAPYEAPDMLQLNALAQRWPHTWGDLYERTRKAWGVAD